VKSPVSYLIQVEPILASPVCLGSGKFKKYSVERLISSVNGNDMRSQNPLESGELIPSFIVMNAINASVSGRVASGEQPDATPSQVEQ
jgi:hypothetical protein